MKLTEVGLRKILRKMIREEETAYQKFFQKALSKFGVKSPADMDDEKKKEFFDYVDKNWAGAEETD
tara:strand:- start:376 stop:573 length:198 start_codon:yes stop_codon:yes gene_type:complete